MPTQTKNQQINLENGFIQSKAQSGFQKLDLKALDNLLLEYAEKYKEELIASIESKQITASGEMEKNITFTLKDKNGIKVLDIYLVDYAKFVDKGVKGWGSSQNAPSSPYSFGNPAKSDSKGKFRENIKKYISSGKAKVRSLDVKRHGAIKGETKGVKLIDARVKTLMYLIRRYGIKTTNFMKEPNEKVFRDLAVSIADEFAVNIAVQIIK
jgi:hypothetical protein